MANENRPLVEVKPGDPITAGRWNDMQRALRQEHIQHGHTATWKDGLFDGPRITTDGLADAAVTAAKIDPRAELQLRTLRLGGDGLAGDALRVIGPTTIEGPLRLAGAAELTVAGPTTLAALKVSAATELAALAVTGTTNLAALKVTNIDGATLKVTGTTDLAALKVSAAAELTSLAVHGALKVGGDVEIKGNLRYDGKLSRLDVVETSAIELRCYDLKLGHSTRLGKLGRALVDLGDRLVVNHGPDWPHVEIPSALLIKGRHAAVAEGTLPRIVWGYFNSEGVIVAGSGFRGERNSERKYTWVYFDKPFAGTPVVLGQQYGSGNVLDNLLVDDVSAAKFSLMCGNNSGSREWRNFGFIAIGPG